MLTIGLLESAMKITKSEVEKLSPQDKPYFKWDDALRGFGVKVLPSGRMVYVAQYRMRGRRQPNRITIGAHGPLMPEQARKAAQAYFGQVALGTDPAAAWKKGGARISLSDVVEGFIEHAGRRRKPRYAAEVKRVLRRDLLAHLKPMAAADLSAADIRRVVELKYKTAPVMANRVLATTKSMLSWAVRQGHIDESPASKLDMVHREQPRDRVLYNAELVAVWNAAGACGYPWGPFYQLAILTGARRSELAGIRRSEIDLQAKVWTIPRERAKNGDPQHVPLGATAISILEGVSGDGDFMLSGNGRRPVSGFSKAQARIQQLSGTSGWSLHDLRRTFRTKLAELKVPHEVAERLIGHRLGGVAAIYNHHAYADEKREAIDQLDAAINQIIRNPEKENRNA